MMTREFPIRSILIVCLAHSSPCLRASVVNLSIEFSQHARTVRPNRSRGRRDSQKWRETPHAGIILGTGLGSVAEQIEVEATLDYGDIPHFPTSTATSHRGRLVCGRLEGVPVVAMEGRFHQYEGYPLKQITLPVRVMKRLGAKLLIVSQAVRRHEPALSRRRHHDHRRPHQPDGRQPADRRQRRPARPAVSRHVGTVRPGADRRGPGNRPPARTSSPTAA